MIEGGSSTEVMPQQQFSFFVAVCFTLNYIIGSGFLTLPFAFYKTGWVLGLLLLGIVTLFSILASWFVLETMARADALVSKTAEGTIDGGVRERGGDGGAVGGGGGAAVSGYHTMIVSPLSINGSSSSSSGHSLLIQQGGSLREDSGTVQDDDNDDDDDASSSSSSSGLAASAVGSRKFEIPELCEMFFGERGRQLYTCVIAIYMYGTLWAYSTVFANAFSSQIPLSSTTGANSPSYVAYLFLFALLVVPMSLMELSEQVVVQVSLSACRIIMLAAMVLTIWVAHSTSAEGAFGDTGETNNPSVLWDSSSVYILLPIAAYANIFHHSIPALSHPVQNKASLGKVYTTALLISFVAYASIGICISDYFGENTKVASNLNWRSYVGGGVVATEDAPLYARIVSFFVVLFPAFDVASAFPLNAITLGNNLMSAVYGSKLVPRMEKSRLRRSLFRLLAALPPMALALVESNLGEITDFTGITGFAVAFIFPALLSLFSARHLAGLGIETKTLYTSRWTRHNVAVATAAVGAFLILFVAISLVVLGPPHGPTRRL